MRTDRHTDRITDDTKRLSHATVLNLQLTSHDDDRTDFRCALRSVGRGRITERCILGEWFQEKQTATNSNVDINAHALLAVCYVFRNILLYTAPPIRCFYPLTLCALQIVFTITITNNRKQTNLLRSIDASCIILEKHTAYQCRRRAGLSD